MEMASFLIAYGTGEGQTAKVAMQIGGRIEARNHHVIVTDVTELASDSLSNIDAFILGSSIHIGRHSKPVRQFVQSHQDRLQELPTGFFQISLSSASEDASRRATAAGYVDSFLESLDWNPDRIAMFGGALRYSKYGFLKRLMMKQIAAQDLGDTDTSRDYEYTDWQEVESFATDFAAFVEARVGGPHRGTAEDE